MWYVLNYSNGMPYYMQRDADHMVNNAYMRKRVKGSEGSKLCSTCRSQNISTMRKAFLLSPDVSEFRFLVQE